MYSIGFYEDKNGESEVRDYLEQLIQEAKTSKNARINKEKIFTYIRALQIYGTKSTLKGICGNCDH